MGGNLLADLACVEIQSYNQILGIIECIVYTLNFRAVFVLNVRNDIQNDTPVLLKYKFNGVYKNWSK